MRITNKSPIFEEKKDMERLKIKDKEKITLQIQRYFKESEESRFIHRLHGVLLFINKEDESCDSIGALFNNSPRSVSNWINKVNQTGNIECLRDKSRSGRPARLNREQKEELKEILQKSPEESGVAVNIWDGKSLSYFIKEKYGIDLKVRACQNLFHELGFSLKRARPVVAKTDEAKKEDSKKTHRKRTNS